MLNKNNTSKVEDFFIKLTNNKTSTQQELLLSNSKLSSEEVFELFQLIYTNQGYNKSELLEILFDSKIAIKLSSQDIDNIIKTIYYEKDKNYKQKLLSLFFDSKLILHRVDDIIKIISCIENNEAYKKNLVLLLLRSKEMKKLSSDQINNIIKITNSIKNNDYRQEILLLLFFNNQVNNIIKIINSTNDEDYKKSKINQLFETYELTDKTTALDNLEKLLNKSYNQKKIDLIKNAIKKLYTKTEEKDTVKNK